MESISAIFLSQMFLDLRNNPRSVGVSVSDRPMSYSTLKGRYAPRILTHPNGMGFKGETYWARNFAFPNFFGVKSIAFDILIVCRRSLYVV